MIPASLPLDTVLIFAAAWLLTYAIHSTVLLGTVWFLARRSFLSPALLDTLWKAALVGGLVTSALQTTGIGAEPLGGRMLMSAGQPAAEYVLLSEDTAMDAKGNVFLAPSHEDQGPRARAQEMLGAWPYLFLGMWGVGAMVGIGRLLAARLSLTRIMGRRRTVTNGTARLLLDRLCVKAGVTRDVRLTASERIGGPVALGASEICLPERALVELTPGQQENVLAHELAHLVRRDPAWRWVSAVVEKLFFFQPLNRVAGSGLKDSAEFLCDDWAVKRTGQHVTLARCLVEVAGWLQAKPRPAYGAGMAEQDSPLVRRVRRLLDGGPKQEMSGKWRAAAAVFLLATVSAASPVVTTVDRGSEGLPLPVITEAVHFEPANVWVEDVPHARHAPFHRWTPGPKPETSVAPRLEPDRSRVIPRHEAQTHWVELVPVPSPSLVIVPETVDGHAIVFTMEAQLEPVRVRMDRLVLELERLNTRIEQMQIPLENVLPVLEVMEAHSDVFPRLLELKEKLEKTGTLKIEVRAPITERRVLELAKSAVLKEAISRERLHLKIIQRYRGQADRYRQERIERRWLKTKDACQEQPPCPKIPKQPSPPGTSDFRPDWI